MAIKDLVTGDGFKQLIATVASIILILMTFIQITPIKLNPWDKVLKWIGNRLNADIKKDINAVKADLDGVKKDLDEHVKASKDQDLRDTRMRILEFCSSCINGQRHSKEQFDFMITQCDDYEKYIEENEVKNGVITSAISEIRTRYDDCLHNNYF